jgi:hypothetical protein
MIEALDAAENPQQRETAALARPRELPKKAAPPAAKPVREPAPAAPSRNGAGRSLVLNGTHPAGGAPARDSLDREFERY